MAYWFHTDFFFDFMLIACVAVATDLDKKHHKSSQYPCSHYAGYIPNIMPFSICITAMLIFLLRFVEF